MSSHSSSRSRRKKKQGQEFVTTRKSSTTLPIFILTLLALLAAAGVWSATRDRSRPIPVDTSDGGKESIAAIESSQSWKRLEVAAEEIQQRISGQQPKDVRDILRVYLALAERQLQLAANDSQKDAAYSKQLSALQGLAASESEIEPRLRLATELSALGLKLVESQDDALASRAYQSLFMASDLILADGLNDEEDASRLSPLLGTWVEQAATRFPTDRSICESIGILLARYPSVKDRDQQLERLVELVKRGYGKSSNPAVVEWAGSVEIKQFFDENKVLSRLSAALTQAKLEPEQLKDLEEQLLVDKPALGKLQFAVSLAQIYEGFDQVSAMQRLLDKVAALDLSEIPEEKRAELQADSQKMRERQSLRGQKLELDLVLRDGTRLTSEQIEQQLTLLIFFRDPAELEKMTHELGVLERMPHTDFRYLLVGPEMDEGEWRRLSGLIKSGSPEFCLPLVAAAEAETLQAKFQIASTVFPVVLDQGRVAALGTPLNRILLSLESRLYGK
jgi:hypothetical protein